MCPYGSFVSRIRLRMTWWHVSEIGVYCSDGSLAGSFGNSAFDKHSIWKDLTVGVSAGIKSLSGKYSFPSNLDSLLLSGTWYEPYNVYKGNRSEWTCSCGPGQLVRGLRKPLTGNLDSTYLGFPYGFKLYCDTPCPSGELNNR